MTPGAAAKAAERRRTRERQSELKEVFAKLAEWLGESPGRRVDVRYFTDGVRVELCNPMFGIAPVGSGFAPSPCVALAKAHAALEADTAGKKLSLTARP